MSDSDNTSKLSYNDDIVSEYNLYFFQECLKERHANPETRMAMARLSLKYLFNINETDINDTVTPECMDTVSSLTAQIFRRDTSTEDGNQASDLTDPAATEEAPPDQDLSDQPDTPLIRPSIEELSDSDE